MALNLLDCTLRDGGYYNDWEFDLSLVNAYLTTMANCDVDYVELGFRQLKNDRYLGAHAYTTYEYLNRLTLPKGPTYGVMVDAKTILSHEKGQKDGVDNLFRDAEVEKIDVVRIAAHFDEVKMCEEMLEELKGKGYVVGLNIMQASQKQAGELSALVQVLAAWKSIDVLYFADSLGCMEPTDVDRLYEALRTKWNGDIGFHAHNNIGKAILNVARSVELGCTWIDGTVTGMGRGAGNAETEFLLLGDSIRREKSDMTDLAELIVDHFQPLKSFYGWGSTVPYYLGALNRIHPTYVQQLTTDQSLDQSLVPKIIGDLGKLSNPSKYDEDTLKKVISKVSPLKEVIDGSVIKRFADSREVLLVAQTKVSKAYEAAIKDYCAKNKPLVLSINLPNIGLEIDYDLVVVSHNEKFREDEHNYLASGHKFVAPKKMFANHDIEIEYDYGIHVIPNQFAPNGSYAIIPNRLTIAYAVSFCIDAGAKKINLVGFGGYDLEDQRHKEMQQFLQILASKSEIELLSLTPTSFSISEISIYGI